MPKMNFSERVNGIFAAMDTTYEEMSNLMLDVALGRDIYDGERKITKAEANERILDFSRQVLGLDKNDKSRTAIRRAFETNGKEWFNIIEDTINAVIEIGLQENEWFNELVETKSINYGDRQDFVVDDVNALLAIAKAGTSHHDHMIQRIGANKTVTIPTELYAVKVGADINKYVVGQVDWAKLVDTIAKSYISAIQEQAYAELKAAAAQLPVTAGFVSQGTLGSGTKAAFDAIIENVSAANNGAEVVIVGTKSALAKIEALANVQWASDSQKDSVANTGNIGVYAGTRLVMIPNRFKDASLTAKVFDSDILMILPVIGEDGKFVKVVDEGETRIVEHTDRGELYTSDLMTYEVQRFFGVGVVIGRQFGKWTLQ